MDVDPPFRMRPSFFPTAGIIGYSQPTPLLDLLSAKLHPFTRSSQYLISCGRVQRSGSWAQCEASLRDFCSSRIPHGVAEAFAVPASQPSFSLCPLLPPSLPRSAVPKRSPQEICTQIPSSESVSRESDLSQGGSKMFSVCDEWTIFIKCTKGS